IPAKKTSLCNSVPLHLCGRFRRLRRRTCHMTTGGYLSINQKILYFPLMTQQPPRLKKALTAIHLWAIAVGLVISGEYFGWNYGWGVAGTVGFLIATLAVTLMYVTFIFSFTELTTSIPHAGGPFAYSYKAFGPLGGLIA